MYKGVLSMEATQNYSPGLEGVIAGVSQVSQVNPDIDSLIYRGYEIRDLAQHTCYEEVAYLLLYGDLPNAQQLESFKTRIKSHYELPESLLQFYKSLPKDTNYMDALRTGVSALAHYDSNAQD